MSEKWCILRMAGPRTLMVAAALNHAGLEAWTPTRMFVRRRPRSKLTIDQRVPIAPTFVFARAVHLATIRAAMALPVSPFPAFSVLQHDGSIPFVADHEISGLRAAEAESAGEWDLEIKRREVARQRGERDAKRRKLAAGCTVTVNADAFLGMTGIVVGSNRREASVDLGGGFVVKIDTWLLVENALVTATH